ncbi:hypothetical protein RS130_06240 [Paraglaciecola aquimarina]|uniref:Uncharacterized protein n=1 Tax=Paraglaciecola aquimarina TaxID=1235557 RepID=A0ABU3SUB0_9ALTE|nr:hypothetical protein [Paraglaciecola aquimarina]MDU0353582.1 hypothetical protein [Paraglaciecola aquimarina]
MNNEAKKIESVTDELAELNRKFHDKVLLSDEFYKQLMQAGFAYRQCLLVSVFPDSANTYCGQLIKQNGDVVEFDIDLDNSKYSSWENITVSFRELYEKNRSTKPWLREVVAYDLFSKLGK